MSRVVGASFVNLDLKARRVIHDMENYEARGLELREGALPRFSHTVLPLWARYNLVAAKPAGLEDRILLGGNLKNVS